MDGSEVDPGFAGLGEVLEVFGETPPPIEPSKGPFHNPAAWQEEEAALAGRTADHRQLEVVALPDRLLQFALVGLIDPDEAQARVALGGGGLGADQFRAITVLEPRGMHHGDQQEAERVDQEVALASLDFFSPRRSRARRRLPSS